MGVVHIEHINGQKLFECNGCSINLSNDANCLSRNFRAANGRAYLFKKVVNVTISEERKKASFMTGVHIIRDVCCKKCNAKLGWYYEHALDTDQRYKEGKFVLERHLLQRSRDDF